MRHVIIGASAAGLSAAEAILEASPEAEVTIVDRDRRAPYARPLISYWLSGSTTDDNVRLPAGVPQGARLLNGLSVVGLDRAGYVELDSGDKLPWDRLLLATGADSKKLKLPGEDAPGVFGFRTWDDAERIDAMITGGARRAVVMGGGLVGVKAALALAARGLEVSVCIASEYALSQNVGPDAGALALGALKDVGVTVLTGHVPEVILAGPKGVAGVRFTTPGGELPCDLVIRGKGVTPCGRLGGADAAIPTDEHMRTNITGVWAAGDVAASRDLISGELATNAIWPVAVEQGRVAGLNMAGGDEVYGGSYARNSVRIGEWHFISAGLPAKKAAGIEIMSRSTGAGMLQLVVRDGAVAGYCYAQKGAAGPVNAGMAVNATALGVKVDSLGFDPLDPREHWGSGFYNTLPGAL